MSEETKLVLDGANAEAGRLKHGFLAPEHLILGLLRDENGSVPRILKSLNVNLEDLRSGVTDTTKPGNASPSKMTTRPTTSWSNKVLELAAAAAKETHDDRIQPHHVLVGVLRHARSGSAQLLASYGLTEGAVLQQVMKLRQTEP